MSENEIKNELARFDEIVTRIEVHVSDENGNKAKVTAADLINTNGVIHVIDSVVLPK